MSRDAPIRLTFLGTGTSMGVPAIGCECAVCTSDDQRDERLRTAVLVQSDQTNIAVDCGPDFRQQMLRTKVVDLDALLITHTHKDHTAGLDDIRPFVHRKRAPLPVYAKAADQKELREQYGYVFQENPYPGAPRVDFHTIDEQAAFQVGDIDIMPVRVLHGDLPVTCFRFGPITYITDAKTISNKEVEKVRGTKILVVNALQPMQHWSHFTLAEALDFIAEIKPERAYLTHVGHRMGKYEDWTRNLPPNVFGAYDGLTVEATTI